MDLTPKNAELVIGIVARIGVDTKCVIEVIQKELKEYRYDPHHIHVTDRINSFSHKLNISKSPTEQRYESLITACNKLREDVGVNVMANLAIIQIVNRRGGGFDSKSVLERNAYVIDQIKRPEECEWLRQVYGEHYIQISCHADESFRIERLKSLIANDHPDNPKSSDWDLKARKLVHVDESQENEKFGQRVREVFPLSDVIIDANSPKTIVQGIERFFRALFGDKSVTPTREEYGMELANTAAQRSSDMSRQVGAAILTREMEIQALGCNEVPKFGGGTYWEGDDLDARDFVLGQDSNEKRRQAVVLDLVARMGQLKMLNSSSSISDLSTLLFSPENAVISDSQIMDSLEYGRSVHAEMNAITDAARTGHSVRSCVLYSSTFPCHNCAKHIVAAGISEVIYNHPYPKSYAIELFSDSIQTNPDKHSENRVHFRQFRGILGPMYSRVFTKARWKRSGGIVTPFDKTSASYIRKTPIPVHNQIEPIILEQMKVALQSKGYAFS